MLTEKYEPKTKTLTSYRRMVLRKYNSKPKDESDIHFCQRFRIPLGELQFWQQLAGQELKTKLTEMAVAEVSIAKNDRYTYAKFKKECAKIIEVTSGRRPAEKVSSRSVWKYNQCELLRYEVLQRVSGLTNTWESERLLRCLLAEIRSW